MGHIEQGSTVGYVLILNRTLSSVFKLFLKAVIILKKKGKWGGDIIWKKGMEKGSGQVHT